MSRNTLNNATPKRRVAHLSSVHTRYDIRIFVKECRSLAEHGYDVHLYIADGKGDEIRDGITIHDIGKSSGRFQRMLQKPWQLWKAVRRNRETLIHFHDPELIPIALLLHWRGVRVIYDAHEDVPRQILSKHWISTPLRKLVAIAFEWLENFAARRFDKVVTATPHIATRFKSIGAQSLNINNYPVLGELTPPANRPAPTSDHLSRTICYIGGISRIRCAIEMIAALPLAQTRLILAGPFQDQELEAEMRAMPGWAYVEYAGIVDRAGVRSILARSKIGMVLFQPLPNHVDALPNKMFEYMSAGVPILASDFPLWQQIMKESGAGRFTSPSDPFSIAQALNEMLNDPAQLEKMGSAGRASVQDKYNWPKEELKLLSLYKELT